MLVDRMEVLRKGLCQCRYADCHHCEEQAIINYEYRYPFAFKEKYGRPDIKYIPKYGVQKPYAFFFPGNKTAEETGTRLHILHVAQPKRTRFV